MPKYKVQFSNHISEVDYDWDESIAGTLEYDEFSEEYIVDDIRISELLKIMEDECYGYDAIHIKKIEGE